MIGILMFALFTFLGIAEIVVNPINSFVLLTIALIYLRGYRRGKSFIYTASLIAVIFALISILTLVASFINSIILNEPCYCKIDYGLAGIIALPLLWKIKP